MAGIILMTNCNDNSFSISLIKKVVLKDFPSGSSIEFHDNQIFLIGDDANYISILDQNYNPVDSITLFSGADKRIPKHKKLDLECSGLLKSGEKTKLLVFGSAATPTREVVLEISLDTSHHLSTINTAVFTARLKQAGIKEVNLEGAAIVKDVLVLANRANESNTINNFITTNTQFYNNQATSTITISEIEIPRHKNVTGISGLAYVPENDMLLYTASTELTGNAYDDGEIGDSYLGWIKNISTKLKAPKITTDGMINLATVDREISAEKIESICVEEYKDGIFYIHLTSDNDKGETGLFKLKLELP
jgi:hypothetical protein